MYSVIFESYLFEKPIYYTGCLPTYELSFESVLFDKSIGKSKSLRINNSGEFLI